MEWIRTIMLNIVILVFFSAVLDFLLPEGSFRSYIKMAIGVFLVLTILQPVMQLLHINDTYKEAYSYDKILE
ncbi:MAG: stage III sporulation protein AF [Peptococcaceae bacterium]|jgi:stage III sporulation protein AF|nr:stage III sporulation protein AF [Peptococcaceae bacterium]